MSKPSTTKLLEAEHPVCLVCHLPEGMSVECMNAVDKQIAFLANQIGVPHAVLLPGIDISLLSMDEVIAMPQAGEYPKTVLLQEPRDSEADGLGHKTVDFIDLHKCAARIWTRSATEASYDFAEFGVNSTRLLLRLPPKELAIGWGIRFEDKSYKIVDAEERGVDQLVTLEAR